MSDPGQPGNRLGGGKEAEVFEVPEGALKLYRAGATKAAAFCEAAHLALVERLNLPGPKVRCVREWDGRWVLVMSLTPGQPFAAAMEREPTSVPEHLAAMAGLHRMIHTRSGIGFGSFKARMRRDIAQATALDGRMRDRLMRRLADLPDGDRLCHGDFHCWNVLGTPETAMVVDWLDAACGPPAADVCRSYLLMLLTTAELASAYLAHYLNGTDIGEADVTAWLPVLAAARLAEGVEGQRDQLLALIERCQTAR